MKTIRDAIEDALVVLPGATPADLAAIVLAGQPSIEDALAERLYQSNVLPTVAGEVTP